MDLLVESTVVLLMVCLFDANNGYPNGQVQGSCSTMEPSHGTTAQTSASPYRLSASKSIYGPGEQITVTISGSSFDGFLIQARSGSSSTPLGSFKVNGNAQTLDCTSAASSVSHTSGSSKSSIQVTWVAPTNSNSSVQLRATVVQTEKVYWTGIVSSTLTYNATSGTGAGNSACHQTAPMYYGLILMGTILSILWV
ncbi:putative ferric-chelate reductase 1 [Phyllobates terribilis]|uniref:putative ferric-chelate reductase 1 n=1 Tax=Phyllobates terribilis TaxID=111132 RepID=UPI003CCB5417